jgi:hypothetical protein
MQQQLQYKISIDQFQIPMKTRQPKRHLKEAILDLDSHRPAADPALGAGQIDNLTILIDPLPAQQARPLQPAAILLREQGLPLQGTQHQHGEVHVTMVEGQVRVELEVARLRAGFEVGLLEKGAGLLWELAL